MGGGVKGSQARYSIIRQEKLAQKALQRTGKDFDLGLVTANNSYVPLKVVNEKQWLKVYGSQEGKDAAAFYNTKTGVIYIRRKYFARLDRGVLTHELLHGQSGPHKYTTKLGRILEEGTVEYLKQYTLTNHYQTKAKKFSKQYYTYDSETSFVKDLMTIVGPKTFVRYWGKGLKTYSDTLAKDLHQQGYTKTAKVMESYNWSFDMPKTDKEIYQTLVNEIREKHPLSNIKNDPFYTKRFEIENYKKPTWEGIK